MVDYIINIVLNQEKISTFGKRRIFTTANNINCKLVIVQYWYASATYQSCLVSSPVFWLHYISQKYKPWLDQTRLIVIAEAYQNCTIRYMNLNIVDRDGFCGIIHKDSLCNVRTPP